MQIFVKRIKNVSRNSTSDNRRVVFVGAATRSAITPSPRHTRNLPSEPRAARNKKSWKQNTRRERRAYQNETFCDLFPGSKKARIRDVTDDDFTLEMQPARWHKLSLILKAVSSVTAVLNHLQEQSVLRWRKDVNGGHKLASVAER